MSRNAFTPASPGLESRKADGRPSFDEVYVKHFAFVWRNVRRLGVPEASVDDALQDVFLVVHRRLADFEGRSAMETWLFGILLRVARDHRRSSQRRAAGLARAEATPEHVVPTGPEEPLAAVARKQALELLYRLLDQLDDDKRAIFVLVELEQLSVAAAAEVLQININTAHARLRAARQRFEEALAREPRRGEEGA